MSYFNDKKKVQVLIRLFFITFVLLGCAVKQPSVSEQNFKINTLRAMLISLSASIDKREAHHLAKSSVVYSLDLAQRYEALSSPWIQNTFVNLGFKKRGLCYEWGEDLLRYLVDQDYETLAFHAIGANIGYLNEHNALSVSAKGEGVENSIILDAWRNSGNLYFKKITEDNAYDWKEREGLYGILK